MKKNKTARVIILFSAFSFLCIASPPISILNAEEIPVRAPSQAEVEPKESLPHGAEISEGNLSLFSKKFTLVAQIDAAYSESKRVGSNSLSGSNFSGTLAPAYRFNDRMLFVVMYNGNYYEKRDYYSDLVGPRERTEFQSHTITPMLRINFGDNARYSVTPSLFYTRTYNKDVAGGGWSDGLYNYKDKGGGLDFKIRDMGYGDVDGTVKFGLQYYEREYPNYESLLDLATGNALERDERDYDGILARAGYSWGESTGLTWGTDYYLLRKELEGKKVVDANGILTTDGQRDYLHGFDLKFGYVPEETPRLRLGVDLNTSFNRSNQNYYDGSGTFPQTSDDVFMDGYYDYNSYRVRPNITYTLPQIPLTPSFSYSYQKTDYRGRRAQLPNGSYKADTQEEIQQEVSVGLRYNILQRLSLFARWQYIEVDSNNNDETVYSYNHKVNNYYAGLSLRY